MSIATAQLDLTGPSVKRFQSEQMRVHTVGVHSRNAARSTVMGLNFNSTALEQKRGAEFVVLSPASISTNWFWDHVQPFATVYSVTPRICFEGRHNVRPKNHPQAGQRFLLRTSSALAVRLIQKISCYRTTARVQVTNCKGGNGNSYSLKRNGRAARAGN